ncbi:MAG: B12-binding domain-containing radical SAM protein [Candidatus Methanospirareceae archaeon]
MRGIEVCLVIAPVWDTDLPPLSVAYLAASLRKEGYPTHLLDFNIRTKEKRELRKKIMEWSQYVHGYEPFLGLIFPEYFHFEDNVFSKELKRLVEVWVKEILGRNPQIIGFSVYNSSALVSLLLAKRIKEENKDVLIVFGGPDCALWMRGNFFIRTNFVDVVVLGEGEETIVDIARAYEKDGKVKGVAGCVINRGGKIEHCGERPLIKDLDSLPFPDFDGLPIGSYGNKLIFPILSSRGCTMNCSFCNERVYWKRYRERSAENVVSEFKHQKEKYGVFHFRLNDSLVNGNVRRLEKLCDLIIKEGIEIYWGGYARAKGMTKELLEKMHKAGCRYLLYGIDSASQSVVDKMQKKVKVEEMEKIIRWTKEAGIWVHTCWIAGFPTESEEDFERSVEFIKRNARFIDSFVVIPCRIKESVDLYNNPEKYGIVIERVEIKGVKELECLKYLPILSENWHTEHITREERWRRTKILTEVARNLIGERSYYEGMPFQ